MRWEEVLGALIDGVEKEVLEKKVEANLDILC